MTRSTTECDPDHTHPGRCRTGFQRNHRRNGTVKDHFEGVSRGPPSFPPSDNLRVYSPKRFGSVAVEANGLVAGEYLGKLLRRELIPADGHPIRTHQGRRVHIIVQSPEAFVATGTALSFIPVGHEARDQTIVWVRLNLSQALLTTVATLRPARAPFHTRLRLPAKCRDGGLSCCHVSRFGHERLRTGYDPFAAIQEVSVYHRKDAEKDSPG